MRPTGAWRLLAASGVCLLSLGLVWQTALDYGLTLNYTLPYTGIDADGWYYTVPGSTYLTYGFDGVDVVHGHRSDARVVLVPAAVILAWAAGRRTPLSRTLTRASVVGMVVLLVWAFSRGRVQASVAMLAALWLAAPVAYPSWAERLTRRRASGGSPTAIAADPPASAPPASGSAF